MQKLERIRDKNIPASFRGENRRNQTLKLLKVQREIKGGLIEKHKFNSTWSPCKKQLLKESYSKCAYCESTATIVSYGDVEHYRPKSKYWWLAYCYDNYLASCTLCNQKYKKAKFDILNSKLKEPKVLKNSTDAYLEKLALTLLPDPLKEVDGSKWNTFEAEHKKERPLLLNPYIDNPEEYFAWEADINSEIVKLIPLNKTDALNLKIVRASEKDYGINRKELCTHRYDVYLLYCYARIITEANNIPLNYKKMQEDIKTRLLKKQSAYSAMLHYFDKKSTEQLVLPN